MCKTYHVGAILQSQLQLATKAHCSPRLHSSHPTIRCRSSALDPLGAHVAADLEGVEDKTPTLWFPSPGPLLVPVATVASQAHWEATFCCVAHREVCTDTHV